MCRLFERARFIIVRPSRLALGQGIVIQAVASYDRGPAAGGPVDLKNGSSGEVGGLCAAFTGVQSNNYWSSTTNANNTSNAWNVNLNNGNVNNNNKTNSNYVWPVRGGE